MLNLLVISTMLLNSSLALANGKSVYETNCMSCHGVKGDGLGDAGKYMSPHPRDFTKGQFKNGSSKQELKHTVKMGIDGTAMPGFSSLTDQELSDVVDYILGFKK